MIMRITEHDIGIDTIENVLNNDNDIIKIKSMVKSITVIIIMMRTSLCHYSSIAIYYY